MALLHVAFSQQHSNPEPRKKTPIDELHPQISLSLQSGLSDTRDFFAFDHSLTKLSEENLSSFLNLDGAPAKTFFLIGFILIKDALTKEHEQAQGDLAKILASFNLLQEYTSSIIIKNSLLTLRHKLADFFDGCLGQSKGKNFDRSSIVAISQFLCLQCQNDEELVYGITQAGRCMIITALDLETAPNKKILLSKICAEKAWALDYDNLEELFRIFAGAFDYYVVLNYTRKIDKICIGSQDASNIALLLSYHSKGSGVSRILYKVTDDFIVNSAISSITLIPSADKKSKKGAGVCDLCKKEVAKEMMAITRTCGHHFCARCLNICKPAEITQCVLKKCAPKIASPLKEKKMDRIGGGLQKKKTISSSMSNLLEQDKMAVKPSVKPRMSLRAAEAGLKTCNLCMQLNFPLLVYTNDACGHNYCLYCVEDTGLLTSFRCSSRKCYSAVDKDQLEDFYNKNCAGKTYRETQNHIPDEGSSDMGSVRSLGLKPHMTILKQCKAKSGEEPTSAGGSTGSGSPYKVHIKLCQS